MKITLTVLFHFHGGLDLQYVLFFLLCVCVLVCDLKLINPPNFWYLSRNMSKATPQDKIVMFLK